MTQGSGANAPDTSGNGYTLTATGTPLSNTGAAIINFNGGSGDNYYSEEHANVPKLDFTGTDPFTLVTRIKYAASGTTNNESICSKWSGTANNTSSWRWFTTNGYFCYFGVIDGSGSEILALGNTMQPTSWNTLAMVFDGLYIRMYINGYLDETVGLTNPLIVPNGLNSHANRTTSDFCIGYQGGTAGSSPAAYMDYLGVFDCALTYEEVMYVHEYWR